MTQYKCSGKCGRILPESELFAPSVSQFDRILREKLPFDGFEFEQHFGPQKVLDRAVCVKCKGNRRFKPLASVLKKARAIKKRRELAKKNSPAPVAEVEAKPKAVEDDLLPEGYVGCTQDDCPKPEIPEEEAFVVCNGFPGHSLPADATEELLEDHVVCGSCLTELNDKLRARGERPLTVVQFRWALKQLPERREDELETGMISVEAIKKAFRKSA